MIFLEDGEVARVDAKGVSIHDVDGRAPRARRSHRIMWDAVAAEKGGYRHFMLKEIHEQPRRSPRRWAAGLARDGRAATSTRPLLTPSG